MKINRFMGQIDSMARSNQFEVEIFQRTLNLRIRGMRCQKVTAPGKSITTNAFSVIPAGPANNTVTNIVYDQAITLDFILDNSFEDRYAIESWMQSIYNDDYSINYSRGESGKSGYLGNVVIRQLAKDDIPIYEVELLDAFPTSLSGLNMDMESSGIQTMTVGFTYRTWHSAFENAPTGSILGGIFNKGIRKLKGRVRKKVEDKVFKEGRSSLSKRLGLGD